MKKIISITLALILIIGISGCNLFQPTTPTDTPQQEQQVDEYENWKTYTNDKFNYSVKVPQSSIVNVNAESKHIEIDNLTEEDGGQWSFTVFENVDGLTLDEYVDKNYDVDDCVTARGQKVLPADSGIVVTYTCTMSGKANIVVLEKGEHFYVIDSGDMENLAVFEKILKTFEFTN